MPPYNKKSYLYRQRWKRTIYILLITKTYKHYGKIYQPLHRFRLQAHIRQGNEQGHLIEFLNDLLKGEHTIMDLRIMNNEQ